jgi:hypothetical protein
MTNTASALEVPSVTTADAARQLHRPIPTIRKMWRKGLLAGAMQKTIDGAHPSRLLLTQASINAQLARETRSPLDTARRGLPTGVLR